MPLFSAQPKPSCTVFSVPLNPTVVPFTADPGPMSLTQYADRSLGVRHLLRLPESVLSGGALTGQPVGCRLTPEPFPACHTSCRSWTRNSPGGALLETSWLPPALVPLPCPHTSGLQAASGSLSAGTPRGAGFCTRLLPGPHAGCLENISLEAEKV